MPTEIRDHSPQNAIHLEAWMEGDRVATARVDDTTLADLHTYTGISRAELLQQMREMLEQYVTDRHRMIELGPIKEDPPGSLKFQASYRSIEQGEATAGIVHYNVSTSVTHPKDISPFIRNKMRTEVHRHLVPRGSAAEELIDLISGVA